MSTPHFALIPAAGMGHLIPFLRLAATLSSHGCQVTLISAQPTVSIAESNHLKSFLSSYPIINHHHYNLVQSEQHSNTQPVIEDPFFQQFAAIRRSFTNLLPIFLNSSPPFTALITDILLADCTFAVLSHLHLPSYILCTSSARFLALISYLTPLLPQLILSGDRADIEIPGVTTISKSSVPPPFLNPNHYFHTLVSANATALHKFDGILINTFSEFESMTLNALYNSSSLPTVLPIGPLPPIHLSNDEHRNSNRSNFINEWLDTQPPSSVVLLSFGSRTAMSKTQITEIAKALLNNIHRNRFVWILKGSKVDRDDTDDLTDLLSKPFLDLIERQKSGVVVNEWVNQRAILSHRAIGGFVSHCGWNSVTEAAERGVPVLAWPLHGDQKLNAEVVVEAGLGIWDKGWGWGGERLVMADEIGRKLVELMEDDDDGLKSRAARVGDEARRAVNVDGSSDLMFRDLVEKVKVVHLELRF